MLKIIHKASIKIKKIFLRVNLINIENKLI